MDADKRTVLKVDNLRAINSFISNVDLEGTEVLRVVKDPKIEAVDEPTYARLRGVDFTDGVIEVEVLSRLLPEADSMARGFIGVAFRINEDDTKFEALYIRPTNGRCDDQVRRNHSTQYFAYPDFKFPRLRKEFPEKYESYADMGLNEWIKLKIEVDGEKARLYLGDNAYPVLVVNDMKLGANISGGIALWVDVNTEGFFKNLKVTNK